MRVLLTGASGFVGSFCLRRLLASGQNKVAVLLRAPEEAWRLRRLLPEAQVICGDLGKQASFEGAVRDFLPEAFVHCAWSGVIGADRNSTLQWRNVPQTLELVEMASRVGAKHWIGIGSQAEYGPSQETVQESAATSPTTLYGSSKLAAGTVGQHLARELGLRFAWLRLFSSFGPGDNANWMIPYLITTLLERKKPALTAAEQLWDYVYIEDVALAVEAVLECSAAAGIYNLGSGRAVKLRTIIEKIRDIIDPELPLGFGEIGYRPDQVMFLEADVSRLKSDTGWKPRVDLELGLRETVSWYLRRDL